MLLDSDMYDSMAFDHLDLSSQSTPAAAAAPAAQGAVGEGALAPTRSASISTADDHELAASFYRYKSQRLRGVEDAWYGVVVALPPVESGGSGGATSAYGPGYIRGDCSEGGESLASAASSSDEVMWLSSEASMTSSESEITPVMASPAAVAQPFTRAGGAATVPAPAAQLRQPGSFVQRFMCAPGLRVSARTLAGDYV